MELPLTIADFERRAAEVLEPGPHGYYAGGAGDEITLRDNERAHDFLTLHQLSVRLLGCTDPDEVVRVSLELLRERTRASVVGFLWASDDGQLKPKLVIPEDAAGKFQLSGDLTEQVMRNITAVLEAAGSGLNQIVKTTVFLADMNDFMAMNEVYARFFPETPPARATIQAARLPRDAKVEIEAIAVLG